MTARRILAGLILLLAAACSDGAPSREQLYGAIGDSLRSACTLHPNNCTVRAPSP